MKPQPHHYQGKSYPLLSSISPHSLFLPFLIFIYLFFFLLLVFRTSTKEEYKGGQWDGSRNSGRRINQNNLCVEMPQRTSSDPKCLLPNGELFQYWKVLCKLPGGKQPVVLPSCDAYEPQENPKDEMVLLLTS